MGDPIAIWNHLRGGEYTCRAHPDVPTFTALDPCVECHRRPKRPTTIEVPDYWKPHGEFLLCTYHHDTFAPDEMCSACVAEDTSEGETPAC